MATRPKAVIESRNGEKFSPITIAKNVLTDDGQNLHDILSDRKEDMMTPTIENSSSMFKVGQGDNVDYSENVVDGAYESMVLKGKSMVNCIQEPSSQDVVLPYEFADGQYVTINDTKESGALGVELKGQTLINQAPQATYSFSRQNSGWYEDVVQTTNEVSFTITGEDTGWGYLNAGHVNRDILKPNTKYLIVCEEALNISKVALMAGNATGRLSDEVNLTNNRAIITTYRELTDLTGQVFYFYIKRAVGNKVKLKNVMFIEYQDGMENWDIPYFEGMTSCKMPILHTVGKNVVNEKIWKTEAEEEGYQCLLSAGWATEVNKSGNPIIIPVHVEKGKVYTLKCKNKATNHFNDFYLMDDLLNGKVKSFRKSVGKNTTLNSFVDTIITFTADKDYKYLQIDTGNGNANGYIVKNTLQLEEGSNNTTYEPYKSSILSLPEEVVLRSLPNGVCDTFNTRTGVYTKRIEEVVLNGIENWTMYGLNENFPDVVGFYYIHRGGKNIEGTINQNYIGNLPVFTEEKFPGCLSVNTEGVGLSDGKYVKISILKSKLSSVDVAGLKAWLQLNPMTVQYELATPIVTKINLPSTLKSWNTTTHIYSEIPENSLYPILSHSNPSYPVILKPSTKYSIVANSYSNDHTNSPINFNLGGATASTTVGNRVTTITTPSTLSNELLTMSGRGNKLNNVMIIEGDVVGDEPYFEGICDCKSPILSNVGKNLFDVDDLIKKHDNSSVVEITKTDTGFNMKSKNAGTWNVTNYSMQLKPNTQYIFNCVANTKSNTGSIKLWNDCESFHVYRDVFLQNTANLEINITFTTQKDGILKFQLNTTRDISALGDVEVSNVSLYELTNQTTYEPYKSNTTTFNQKVDKTVVLRSLPSGVCDTLNVETGEYVQRIGEIVLNGSETEWRVMPYPPQEDGTHYQFQYWLGDYSIGGDLWNNSNAILADRLPSASGTLHWGGRGDYGIGGDRSNIMITWEKNSCPFNDVTTLNAWLQANPITVQYELATPVVSTIDIQGFPFSYENGHVILSSGSIEQSLTPKVEYSVVTNRNGQIRSNQKMVERHQKQLDRLQAMVLTNLVNTQYEQTLTNLKYDLKNVREEVK